MKAFLLLIFSTLISFSTHAGDTVTLEDAIKILADAPVLESRYIGYAGVESQISKAYLLVASNKNAKEIYLKILKNPSVGVDTIYALMWSFENDKKLYFNYRHLLKKDTPMNVLIGCIMDAYSLNKIQELIENGQLKTHLMYD